MSPELFQAIESQGAAVDLSDRAKFMLTGEDRVRYLNGQVTNDVRKADARHALYACVTNVKGRIEGDIFIHVSASADGLCLDAEPGLREPLGMRLERYIIADDVELQDITEEWRIFHLFGKAAEAWLHKAGDGNGYAASRFRSPGVDLWLRRDAPLPELPACPVLDAAQVNEWRILHGIPRWPEELNGEAFPQEAGLETTAMDFHKGCYIGQEILSRIKTTGKMPRELMQFSVPGRGLQVPAVPTAWSLVRGGDAGPVKEGGVITSIAQHPVLDRIVCLAYVRQGLDKDSLLLVPEPLSKIPIHIEPIFPQ